jgi:hypothetical protein
MEKRCDQHEHNTWRLVAASGELGLGREEGSGVVQIGEQVPSDFAHIATRDHPFGSG